MFWLLSFLVLLIAATVALFPMLRGRSAWQPVAFALAGTIPIAGLYLYDHVGRPNAIHVSPPTPPPHTASNEDDIDQMVRQLRARLTQTEEDLEGWLLLTRTLKNLQRYDDALEAAETAAGIAPDNATALVELVEARIFTSPDGVISPINTQLLEQAVAEDPRQQKALWLLGIAFAQAGEYQQAIDQWSALLEQMEPGSNVANSVTQQINEARAALGQPPVDAAPAKPSLPITVNLAEGAEIPPNAVLFVIARADGPAAGPPLAVKRFHGPVFPLNVALSDDDTMMEGNELSAQERIQLQARVSVSGGPAAQPGDWQSAVQVIDLAETPHVELVLDQRVE